MRTATAVVACLMAAIWLSSAGTAAAENDVLILEGLVDIEPGSEVNPINPGSRGVIPVAILGSDTFDAGDRDRFRGH